MKGKRLLSLVLTVCMLMLCVPASAFAASGEAVIDKVTFNKTEYSPKGKEIVLSVANSFSGTINLAEELSLTYNKLNYKYFAPLFPDGSTIRYGETKTLRAQYQITENGGSSLYTTDYTVSLKKDEYVKPSFAGNITIRVSMDNNDGYRFTRKQFEDLYTQNDGKAFGGIIINGASSKVSFHLNSTTSNALNTSTGGKVDASSLDRLYVAPKAVGKDSLIITPVDASGNAVDGYISLDVEVIKTTALSTFNVELSQLETYSMRNLNLATKFKEAAAADIDSVKITELPGLGRLVYNYSSNGSYGNTITRDNYMSISDFNMISYIPNRDSITRNVSDSFRYTARDKAGHEFSGTVAISVLYQRMGLEDLTATAKSGEPAKLNNLVDIRKAYETSGEGTFGYVYFTLPDSSAATLRYNYRNASNTGDPVTENNGYYLTGSNRKYLSDVYFVPSSDYSGSVYLYYEAYNSKGEYPLYGRIRINISTYQLTDLSYSVYQDEYLNFEEIGSDINSKFKNADSGSGSFSYVRFTIPSSSYGTLFYNYQSDTSVGSKVSSGDNYYRSGTGRQLADVSFVPNSSYSGSFILKYNAYDTAGNAYTGEIEINVRESKYDLETLVLNTKAGRVLQMPSSTINQLVRDAAGDASFNYIYFSDLPLSRSGSLYYNYEGAGTGTPVEESSSDTYSRTGTERLLSDVSFVPAKDFSGNTEIEYRAYVSRAEYYDGKIIIRVAEGNAGLPDIEYETPNNIILDLAGGDFATAVKQVSASSLDYVIFELPDSSKGTFYYDFTNDSTYGYKAEKGDKFYRLGSEDLISILSFVPATGYIGTFQMDYTAFDTDGEEYEGVVTIKVTRATDFEDVAKTAYYYDSVRWAVDQKITDGTSRTKFSPDKGCTRAHVITFLWRAKGCPEPKSVASPFSDVKSTDYFYKPALWAFENNIYPGTSEGLFAPDKVCTRRDFVYLLWLTEGKPSAGVQKNIFKDVKDDDPGLTAILWAYKTGVTDGTNAAGSDPTFSPDRTCTRAHVVTFLYRAYH